VGDTLGAHVVGAAVVGERVVGERVVGDRVVGDRVVGELEGEVVGDCVGGGTSDSVMVSV